MSERASIPALRRLWTRHSTLLPYGAALLAAWCALSLWTLLPFFHRHPYSVFLFGVVLTARFFGSGPALLCSGVSAVLLEVIVLPPRFRFALSNSSDLERLALFLLLSLLIGSLVRQRTQAESRAERTIREMAAIVEGSDDAIFSTNPEGVIISWNRGAERLYGYTAEEAVGSHVLALSPPDRQGEVESNRDVLNRGESVTPYETLRLRKDGAIVPVLLTVSPLRNARGDVVGASAVARDMSAQRHSQEAVRRSEKLATAGRLAAAIAHEINNPLEAVLNLLYLARNDPRKAEQYLSMAEQEVGRVARLAQQTLGFVRDTNSLGRIDPADLMDETLLLYSRKLESKKIHVARRYRGRAEISGYAGEIRQLLANLLVNAVDAMQEGGSLQVRVSAGRPWSNGARGVRIVVADNGTGIGPDGMKRLFEPFYSTKEGAGTGLGLWVAHGIVKKHGGSIRVRSRTEGARRGSIFCVFLPAASAALRVA